MMLMCNMHASSEHTVTINNQSAATLFVEVSTVGTVYFKTMSIESHAKKSLNFPNGCLKMVKFFTLPQEGTKKPLKSFSFTSPEGICNDMIFKVEGTKSPEIKIEKPNIEAKNVKIE